MRICVLAGYVAFVVHFVLAIYFGLEILSMFNLTKYLILAVMPLVGIYLPFIQFNDEYEMKNGYGKIIFIIYFALTIFMLVLSYIFMFFETFDEYFRTEISSIVFMVGASGLLHGCSIGWRNNTKEQSSK